MRLLEADDDARTLEVGAMIQLFSGGTAVDLVIALVGLEAFAVLGWRAMSGGGPAPLPFLSNLLAGTFLLLALRDALGGGGSIGIAACLIASLVAHLADLRLRWATADAQIATAGQPELRATIARPMSKANVGGQSHKAP
jgi:hypothetical protein